MMIGNPKIRKKMNFLADSIILIIVAPIFLFAYYGAPIYGAIERKFKKQ